MIKIVIDMMGGDNGAKPIADTVKLFIEKREDISFYCVGRIKEFNELMGLSERVILVNADDIVNVDDEPFTALKKKDSSMMKAFDIYKQEKADAIITCGGTGPFLSGATLLLGRIKGVKKPALVTAFPTKVQGKYTTALDIGANVVVNAEDLHVFAKLGSLYHSVLFGVDNPKVRLLSVGTEDHKGTPVYQEAFKLLKNDKDLNFQGNLEARNFLFGEDDVVVADGFSGNILLKSCEGVFKIVSEQLNKGFRKSLKTKLGYLFSRSVIKDFKDHFNYKSVGGAMFLGIDGLVLKAHGNSDVEGFTGAINSALKMISADMIKKAKERFAQ